jgi:hypothetical protein
MVGWPKHAARPDLKKHEGDFTPSLVHEQKLALLFLKETLPHFFTFQLIFRKF